MGDQGPLFFSNKRNLNSAGSANGTRADSPRKLTAKLSNSDMLNNKYMLYPQNPHLFRQRNAKEITLTSSLRNCKSIGRATKGFDEKVWNKHGFQVVEEGSYSQYTRGIDPDAEELKQKLLEAGGRELVEASPFDHVWGIGFTAEQAKRGKKSGSGKVRWGKNLLGLALMNTRRRIREEEAKLTAAGDVKKTE
ncbi:N-glycosidase [Lachnellula cervina]|uniref:N-glycosidase n=1 Tax=Lachnellula cervina TaxID=1316786 RepID=A0A7D8Z455_9HELO|nr:N-glycosidase [Lachnellula cervina]